MTWNEFKKKVDEELSRQGANGDFDLIQIDFDGQSAEVRVDTTSTFYGIEIEG